MVTSMKLVVFNRWREIEPVVRSCMGLPGTLELEGRLRLPSPVRPGRPRMIADRGAPGARHSSHRARGESDAAFAVIETDTTLDRRGPGPRRARRGGDEVSGPFGLDGDVPVRAWEPRHGRGLAGA